MLIAVLLGSDSFLASASLAPTLSTRVSRIRLVLLFAGCDGLASLAGQILGLRADPVWLGLITPLTLAAGGLYLLAGSRFSGVDARVLYVAPLLLSFDNLLVRQPGIGSGWPAVVAAISASLGSGAMAVLGLAIGALLAGAFRRGPGTSPSRAGGLALLSAAVLLLLG